jgi:hypothetical protein
MVVEKGAGPKSGLLVLSPNQKSRLVHSNHINLILESTLRTYFHIDTDSVETTIQDLTQGQSGRLCRFTTSQVPPALQAELGVKSEPTY